MKSKPHVAVIGAGAFGGWTALHLLENGARVTLLDAWGPGNSRASSGGETRIMRATYGPNQPYTAMAARALKLWTKYERHWKRQFPIEPASCGWPPTGRTTSSVVRSNCCVRRESGLRSFQSRNCKGGGRRSTLKVSAGEFTSPI